MEPKLRETEDDDEHIFQESNIPKVYRDLDETFRCQICANLFDKAVTIKECGHTFCSICIRNYFVTVRSGVHRQKKACPICRTSVDAMDVDKALVMNRSIQDAVVAFKQLLLKHQKSRKAETEPSSPRRSKRRRSSNVRTTLSSTNDDENSNDDDEIDFTIEVIEGDGEQPIQSKMQSRNYGRMKRTDLQKLCRQYGIPTSGNEQDLIGRMRKFQSMWNAEVDSIKPRTPSDLAAQLKKEEKAQQDEKKLAVMNGAAGDMKCMEKLSQNIKSGNTTSGNASFDRKMKSNFDAMVDQLRRRAQKKPGPAGNDSKTSCSPETCEKDGGGNQKNGLSDGTGDQISLADAASIDIIDIDACSKTPERITTVASNEDKDLLETILVSPNEETVPDPHSNVSCISKSNTTAPVIEQSARKQRRRKTSFAPTNRTDWACKRCTYSNLGIDFMCKMCGQRKG